MKKILITASIFSAIICTAYTVSAQSFGLKGGVNFADISNFNGNNRVSGHAGVFMHQTLSRNWCIQPEILYSGEGQKFNVPGGEATITLSYIQVPVMFQYFPVKQFYLEAGPELSVLTHAGLKDRDGNKTDMDDAYNTASFGIGLGTGIQATTQLGFYFRYNLGLSDITTNNNRTNTSQVAQLGMSIRLK